MAEAIIVQGLVVLDLLLLGLHVRELLVVQRGVIAVVAESRVCNCALKCSRCLRPRLDLRLLSRLRVESGERGCSRLELGLRLFERYRCPLRRVRREIPLTDSLGIGWCHYSGTC